MLKLQRKSMLNGRSPTQKPMRKTSGDSMTEESSSFSFRDDNDFSDLTFESPRRVLHAPLDSMYTNDQVVLQPDERERPRVGLHTSVDGLERVSKGSDPSRKKKMKKKQSESHEERKGKSKPNKSSPKAASGKTKKKRPAKNTSDSPFWSLMETGQQLLSINGAKMPNSHTVNSEPSDGFGEPLLRDDRSFASNDGSILLPSKASMQVKERRSLSPKHGGRRAQRTKVSTATGTMPSKAGLERSESNKAYKKKRRPKPSNDLQSPTGVQKELDNFLRENAADELSPSSVSSRSQSSKSSRKTKGKKTVSTDGFRKSKAVSPKPVAKTTSLSPAVEGKPSSFSGLNNSFLACDETATSPHDEDNKKSKMIQPSKASLESMLERVTIRKKTRKSSASSVGSRLRGKRPQPKAGRSDDSVVSLDTGMKSRKANQTNPVRQDSLSAENSAALSVGSRKNRQPVVSKAIPRRAVSYQSKVKEPVNHSPVSVDGAPMRRSKASLQKVLETRDSVKSRKTSASSVGSRRSERSPQRASPSSPKSILKVTRRNSFGNGTSDPTEPRVVVERRASFSTNTKHPSAHALTSFGDNSNEEAIPSDQPKRRGVKSSSLKIVKGKAPPTTTARNQRSRSLSPMAKGFQAPSVKVDLADDPWDNIDEAFMPITSAKREEQAKKVVEETKPQSRRPVKTPDDMWKSLACLDTSNSSPNAQPTQRKQQLKATEVLDAWWNVEEDDDQSQATRKKKLAQKSSLLVSSKNVPSTTSGSKLYSPPSSAAAATKTPMHASMPMPSLDNSVRTTESPSSSKQRQSDPALPSMGKKSSSPANSKPQRQSEPPKRAEVVDAWWAAEDDKQSVAKETKKKQLARKSVLLVGNSSISSLFSGRSFDFSDDEEEIENVGTKDDGRGRQIHSGAERRTASQSPGRLARNNRRMVVKQPSPNSVPNAGFVSLQQRQIRPSY